MSSRRASAGCPASSSRRFSSERVTTMVGPMGRQPWLTTVLTLRGPLSITPIAPSVYISPPANRRTEPWPRMPLASPPTSGRLPRTSAECSTKASVGKL